MVVLKLIISNDLFRKTPSSRKAMNQSFGRGLKKSFAMSQTHSLKKQFTAELPELEGMLSWARGILQSAEIDSTTARKVELALEEALVNVICYAYPNGSALVTIELSISPDKEVELVIEDRGVPFNPLNKIHKINKQASLQERDIGGLGIPFIYEIMDEMSYERLGEKNILKLRKNSA